MKKLMFFAAAVSFAIVGCATPPVVLTPVDGGKYVIEVESMTLVGCQIVDDAKASGGKAVKLLTKTSTGTFKAQVKPGQYELTLPIFAPNPDADAFVITANDKQVRTYPTKSIPDDKGRYSAWVAPDKTLPFTVGSDGIAVIGFKAAEFGMNLDKFEIVPVK